MRSTIHYKKRDIILVPFPFTDLSTNKRRPSLIISPDDFNQSDDSIIAFITSNIPDQLRFGDYSIKDWKNSGLPLPSIIRMKFATISNSIVIRKLGKLSENDIINFENHLIEFFKK